MASENDIVSITETINKARSRLEIKSALQKCLDVTSKFSKFSRNGDWFPVGEAVLYAVEKPSFLGALSKREQQEFFVDLFISAPTVDCFFLLINSLKITNENGSKNTVYFLEKILLLLDAMVRKNLRHLFIDLLTVSDRDDDEDVTTRFLQTLVSIPDRTNAIFMRRSIGECSSVLDVENFATHLASAILASMEKAHDFLKRGRDCSLKFHSTLLGKAYLCGYGRSIVKILATALYARARKDEHDFIWRRLAQRLFTGGPTAALENLVADIVVAVATKYGRQADLALVLGDSIQRDDKIVYIFTNKLLLTRHFDESSSEMILFAIFRYLSTTRGPEKNLSASTCVRLLTVWSTPTTVTRTHFDKYFYLSRAILICVNRLTEDERSILKNEATPLILRGVSAHLNAVDEQIRKIGMVVGELLTNIFLVAETKNEDEEKSKLKFQYADDDYTLRLKRIFDLPAEKYEQEVEDTTELFLEAAEENFENSEDRKPIAKDPNFQYKIRSVLDSDDEEEEDDLQPYEIPNENTDENRSETDDIRPVYIRDCLDAIHENKSFRHYESALKTLEKLITNGSPGVDDFALEMCRILLHAEDRYGMGEDYLRMQRQILTACCVRQPKMVAPYLIEEFYSKNYSVQVRLLMLDVVIAAAKKLSDPTSNRKTENKKNKNCEREDEEPPSPTPFVPTWRVIVQQRLEKTTRRWGAAKTGKAVTSSPVSNRFSQLAASYFFYPLISGLDRNSNLLDPSNLDYVILGQILFATGTILYEAENAIGACAMAGAQMQIVRRTRGHEQAFVRQASLFAFFMAVLITRARILAVEFQDELLEAREWLEKIMGDDPDEQCRNLARQTLSILMRKIEEGLNSLIDIGSN